VDFGAFARRGFVFKPAAGPRGALFHAQQAQTPSADRLVAHGLYIKPHSIVANEQVQISVAPVQINGDGLRVRVLNNIVDGLLGDTEAFRFDDGIQAAVQGIGVDICFDAGAFGLPLHVPTEGRFEAQIIEHRRPQFERQIAHLVEHQFDGTERFLQALPGFLRTALFEGIADIHFRYGKILADFIVQLARQMPALGFLRFDKSMGKHLQSLAVLHERSFGASSFVDVAPQGERHGDDRRKDREGQ
jgi:hypothetical protein